MPPKEKMTEPEKRVLRDWIASGAGWGTDPIVSTRLTTSKRAGEDWWSLQPVQRPNVPVPQDKHWPLSPVDAFILSKLEAEGLRPTAPADRRTLIRRLSYDLLGLPPAPEEVASFLADQAPNAYETLVDRMLASPSYGVRWARWWLDLARYGESNGFEYDEFRPNAWRYRDWVVQAWNSGQPYDEFVRWQLAGDLLEPGNAKAFEATGFLVAGAYDTAGQNQQSLAMRAVVRADELEDVIGTTSQTFLGLTVNCARCHDHKFDPIRQEEYYRLASALEGVRHGERDLTAVAPELKELRQQAASLQARLKEIEDPVREQLLGRRQASSKSDAPPAPLISFDFDRGDDGVRAQPKIHLHGGAEWTAAGLGLDGITGYAETAPLRKELSAKTIEAWVRLSRLEQAGGGLISIQSGNGGQFDALVYGERESAQWMAGSEGFARYQSVHGGTESDAIDRPVHLAATYAADGSIRLYRDGRPYGNPYRASGPVTFPAGETTVLFGLRHAPAGGNRMLAGTIVRARVYDRALNPAEVEASARSFGDYVDPSDMEAAIPAEHKVERTALLKDLAEIRTRLAATVHRAYAVTPREAGITRVHLRGNPGQPGATVAAGGVAAIRGVTADFGLKPDAPEASRRLGLARWITDRKNPLFARVLVNRLWQAHFGTGLVENSSDLGFSGGHPSHPELLDWLASEAAANGWNLKRLQRLIVTSAVYRQGSASDRVARAKDTSNRWLWRKSPVRLEAEMVRDAMLSVSGSLNKQLDGPSFRDYDLVQSPGTPAVLYVPADPGRPELARRSLYRAWARGGRSAFLDVFDCPDPSTTTPRRAVTTTPLQALSLMNSKLVLHLSDVMALRLERDAGKNAGRQVERAYWLAFGRGPSEREQAEASAVVKQFGAAVLVRAIFNSSEFLHLD
jgi:hypothetical protein